MEQNLFVPICVNIVINNINTFFLYLNLKIDFSVRNILETNN